MNFFKKIVYNIICLGLKGVEFLPLKVRALIREKSIVLANVSYEKLNVVIEINSRSEVDLRVPSLSGEPEIVNWISKFDEDSVFFDVGANVGIYSIAAAQINPSIKVVSFEPAFVNYGSLCHNIIRNKVSKNITTLPIALNYDTGIGTFLFSSLDSGSALHTLNDATHPEIDENSSVHEMPMLCFAMDELTPKYLSAPRYIKIDVDGAELGVLSGAEKTLAGVKSVFIEASVGEHEDRIISFMEKCGFTTVVKHKRDIEFWR